MLDQLFQKTIQPVIVLLCAISCSAAIVSGVICAEQNSESGERHELKAYLVQQWQERLSHPDYEERELATQDLMRTGGDALDVLVELMVSDDLEVAWRGRTATIGVFSQLGAEGRIDLLSQLQTRLAESPQLPVGTRSEVQELIDSLQIKTAEVISRLAQSGVEIEISQDRTLKVSFRANAAASESLFANMRFVGPVSTLNLMRLSITDDQLRYLKHLEHLERLYLKDTGLNGSGLKHLTGLPKLNSISLQGLKLKPEAFDALAQMNNLQYLGLDQTSTTDEDLAKLSGLKQLKYLWLNETKVTDRGFAAIGNMDGLEKLVLTDVAIDGSGLEELTGLKNLKYLSLEGCPVDDSIMKQLQQFVGLETLGLDKTRVTDKAVAEIKEMKHLKVLWLAGTRITDRCIPDLLEMQNLERLLLFNCKISEREFQRLKTGLPDCAINELK